MEQDCQVSHTDHKEGLQDIRQRHQNFYQELIKIIEDRE